MSDGKTDLRLNKTRVNPEFSILEEIRVKIKLPALSGLDHFIRNTEFE